MDGQGHPAEKKVYGIDLGTTYSAIACINAMGRAEIIPNAEGYRTTPSAVLFEPGEESGKPNVIVGKVAKEQACTDPDRFVEFVKPHMGTDWKKDIEGYSWTPEMISAEILRKLVQGAEAQGERVEDVVVACPTYFGHAHHCALKAAVEIAGLNLVGTITEPGAVALHYGLDLEGKPQTAVVYDLGGATFDVTVLRVVDGNIEIVCTDGLQGLGGRDWDGKVVRYLAERFAEENGGREEELLSDPETYPELCLRAEFVKLALSSRAKTLAKVCHGENSSRIEVTRETFDALTGPLLEETALLTERILSEARCRGVTHFDRFLLAGGAAHMPQVMDMVKTRFGNMLEHDPELHDPDEAVAKGAALRGDRMRHPERRPHPSGRRETPEDRPEKRDPSIDVRENLGLLVENAGGAVLARCPELVRKGERSAPVVREVSFSILRRLAGRGVTASVVRAESGAEEPVAQIWMSVPESVRNHLFRMAVEMLLSRDGRLTLKLKDLDAGSMVRTAFPLGYRAPVRDPEDIWLGLE